MVWAAMANPQNKTFFDYLLAQKNAVLQGFYESRRSKRLPCGLLDKIKDVKVN